MADVLIEPLDLADFDPSQVPTDPGFTELLNNELGVQATDLDGFSLVFDEAVAIVDALGGALEGLGFALLDSFAEADTIDEAPLAGDIGTFTAGVAAGQAVTSEVDTLLGTVAPAPPAGGGGGAPAGAAVPIQNATGPVLDTPNEIPFPSTPPNVTPLTLHQPICNHDSVAHTIDHVVLVQADPSVFTLATDCTTAFPAGSCCNFRFTLTRNMPDGTMCQLQAYGDWPGSPALLNVVVGGVNTVSGGGAGGGGPIRIFPDQ